jgi:hypothetical protein
MLGSVEGVVDILTMRRGICEIIMVTFSLIAPVYNSILIVSYVSYGSYLMGFVPLQ